MEETELNFCPYCDAPSHKLLMHNEDHFFCRECNKFFELRLINLVCPKCESTSIIDSDFPSPDGEIILQCKKCKKMFPAKTILEKNKM